MRLCLRLLPLWHAHHVLQGQKLSAHLQAPQRPHTGGGGFLLGVHSGAKVSRYERLSRRPSFQTALGLQAVFGVPAEALLPAISTEVERKIMARAHLLSRRLERHSDSARTKRKSGF